MGGAIRIAVPDLKRLSEIYLESIDGEGSEASTKYLYALNLHRDNTYPIGGGHLRGITNLLQGYPHQHKYMYDVSSLESALKKNGFSEIEASFYGESKYLKNVIDVECTAEGIASIYVEAKK